MGNVFGSITKPSFLGSLDAENFLGKFISLAVKWLVVGAALYAMVNLVLAGDAFISAGDDPKKAAGAWAKIYQTLLGLAVAAGSFVLAEIFSRLIFGNNGFNILKPSLPTL
jgi:hypothetical protein